MTPTSGDTGWSRGRLLGILAAAVAVALLLLAGVGYVTYRALTAAGAGTGTSPAAPVTAAGEPATDAPEQAEPGRRAAIAAAPMLRVQASDAREGQISTEPAPAITVPSPDRTGPRGVATGYPATPQGALAQLAAIDVAVLQSMSIPVTHQIHEAWTTGPGEPGAWVMTENVQVFLTAAEQSGQTKTDTLSVTAAPAAGQVKGLDDDDWVLACVLLDVRAGGTEDARIAYGHCEAMAWAGDRWLIDTTHDVAQAPSTWPGTDLAARAGWRTWASTGDPRN